MAELPSKMICKNKDLEKADTRNAILKYLYERVKSMVPIVPIVESNHLDLIKNNKYIICPRINGVRSWLVFFIYKDVYYAVNFPKQNTNKQVKLRIFPIDILINQDAYIGTIMEGIYCCSGDHRHITIDNVYFLRGKNQNMLNHSEKLTLMQDFVSKETTQSDKFTISVSKYYPIQKDSILELFDSIKKETNIGEITFYPEFPNKRTPVFQYTILDTDLQVETIVLSSFKMTRTDKPDVYDLECLSEQMKPDIAYIPDIETSKKCKEWFKGIRGKNATIIVTCKFFSERNKWMPIEKISNVDKAKKATKKKESESEAESETESESESSSPPKKVGKRTKK